jgi:glutamate-1-semialdehyde 2,1-aminomutase
VVPFNDDVALDEAFARHGDDLAAVIVEPVPANMGLVAPADGFLEGVRRRCTAAGALLVFDEVITGFRVGMGGAQTLFGVTPDLSLFGKVIGGGLPLAAVGGRADVMDELAPLGPVYQAGTLSGNPLATAAGLAVLSQLDNGIHDELAKRTAVVLDSIAAACAEYRIPVQTPRVGALGGVCFSEAPVHDYADAQAADHERYAAFFHALLDRGVFLAPSGYEVLFVSAAHTDEVLEMTTDAIREAIGALA